MGLSFINYHFNNPKFKTTAIDHIYSMSKSFDSAERNFHPDSVTTMVSLRKFAEHLCKAHAILNNKDTWINLKFEKIIGNLYREKYISKEQFKKLNRIRKVGNIANHQPLKKIHGIEGFMYDSYNLASDFLTSYITEKTFILIYIEPKLSDAA